MRSISPALPSPALLAAACAAALASGCGGEGPATPVGASPGILKLPAGWTVMEPGGETTCARDTPFSYFVRPGTVNRLVVEFRGGGACWNALTCGFAGSTFQETVGEDPWVLDESQARGIYDHDNPENPFKDWHHVYIPYCTGDIHWGDSVQTYGTGDSAITIHHKGAVNVRAALDWVYENVPAPEKVFVAGCSAGAYGSILWSSHLREHYSGAQVYQLADSGAGIVTDTFFQDSYPAWNAGQAYPTWIPGVSGALERLPLLYAAIGGHYPDMTLAQYNTTYDEDQVFYFKAMGGGDAQDWSAAMQSSVAEIAGSTPNFRSFQAPGELHCILPRPELYTAASSGVRLVDWIRDMVDGKPVQSVACEGAACGAPGQN
jgi:hypothetical protein